MGWNYRYVLMPSNFDIAKFKANALANSFIDFTELNKKAKEWEEERIDALVAAAKDRKEHDYTEEELKAKSDGLQKFLQAESDDEELKKYQKNLENVIFQLWFDDIEGRYEMFYTSDRWDITGKALSLAISCIYRFGVRGTVWVVGGNSVVDAVTCNEYTFEENENIRPGRTAGSDEGRYAAFLKEYKETGVDLSKIHDSLVNEGSERKMPALAVGIYLESTGSGP